MNFQIVVPSKTPTNIMACLKAVREHEPTASLIVIDDGLGQQCCDQLAFFEPIQIIKGQPIFIFARAVNAGIRAAGSDSVVILNDDALLESPGGFSLLARTCEEHPEIGVIGATTNLTGQPLQWRKPATNASYGLRFVSHLAYVCVYLPRHTIETVGLLDERYTIDWGCEDADHCEAIARAGLKICVEDRCYVDHGSLRSTKRGDPRNGSDFSQNLKLLLAKWGRLITQPNLFSQPGPNVNAEIFRKQGL